jgi:hypothetical protein
MNNKRNNKKPNQFNLKKEHNALASGSPDALVKMITDDVAAGIRKRYLQAAATYKHKDERVEKGREFVKAYVDYTHYVERIHLNATGKGVHDEHLENSKHR